MSKIARYLPTHSMRDLIRDNAMLLPAISRFDIAFGFGDASVVEVCKKNGVDVKTFLCVCNLLSGNEYLSTDVSLKPLMVYLRRAHSSFLDVQFPRIRAYLIDAVNHSESYEQALMLMRFYDEYVDEVRRHMVHENDIIFNYADNLNQGRVTQDFRIANYSVSHVDTAHKLKELKDIFIYHFKQKENMRLSGALFEIIMCERDLMLHFEVESRLFIPAVELLESKLKHIMPKNVAVNGNAGNIIEKVPDLLSDREKDIVRGVARGKSNKEIASDLFISVHTVATHRRNICSKLGIHSPAGLVIYAIINHIVDIDDVSSLNRL